MTRQESGPRIYVTKRRSIADLSGHVRNSYKYKPHWTPLDYGQSEPLLHDVHWFDRYLDDTNRTYRYSCVPNYVDESMRRGWALHREAMIDMGALDRFWLTGAYLDRRVQLWRDYGRLDPAYRHSFPYYLY